MLVNSGVLAAFPLPKFRRFGKKNNKPILRRETVISQRGVPFRSERDARRQGAGNVFCFFNQVWGVKNEKK